MNRKAAIQATKDLAQVIGFALALVSVAILISFGMVFYPYVAIPVGVVIVLSFWWYVLYQYAKRYS